MSLVNDIKTRKEASYNALKDKRLLWDKMENLYHGILSDQVSLEAKSQVFDHRLSTLNDERAYRVMAQLPTGKVRNVDKNDKGGSMLMNLILEKSVFKNANAQFPFLTKLRMVDSMSGPYGNVFVLIDWDVKKNGYVGPDMWILNMRDVFPQVGAVSVEDSDHIIIRSWKPLSYFENLKRQDGYKNIDKIVTKLKNKSGSKQQRDADNETRREEDQYTDTQPTKGRGFFEVLSQYEGDRWVDMCVDADEIFRDVKNPHDNGELPIVCKYSIPLLDDFMGTSRFQRGASMQMTVNSVWNLYLDAVKMSIFPPTLVNKDNIASMSSLKWGPTKKWLVRNQIGNAVSPVNLSPQGTQTFNNTHQAANASLINQFGTSDTSVKASDDYSLGKTPQALKMQAARENTGDSADRFFMEQFLTQSITKMVNLISKKQPAQMTVRMFDEEIKQLARDYPEIEEMYNEKTGKLKINKGMIGEAKWDYEIVTGSTYALDQEQQQTNLASYIKLYLENGQALESLLQRDGLKFNFGEMFKRAISNSGINDWDKILEEIPEEERAEQALQADAQAFQQAVQQMQGVQQMGQVPQQPMGQQLPPMQ